MCHIPCSGWPNAYVDQTGRQLSARVKAHKGAVRRQDENYLLALHCARFYRGMEHYLHIHQSMRNNRSRLQSSTRILAATKARASPDQLNHFNVSSESHTTQPSCICTNKSLYRLIVHAIPLIVTWRSVVAIGLKICDYKSPWNDVAQTERHLNWALSFHFLIGAT